MQNDNKEMYASEEEIIAGCIKKDIKYMELLYKQYASKLFNCALRYTKNKEDAEDVLQDAFIQIFEHMKQYNGKGTFQGWMTTIVINQAFMLYRKNIKQSKYQLVDFEDYKDTMKDTSVVQHDFLSHQLLLEMIQNLPDGYRMVFNMHEIEGFSFDEIEKELHCTPTTCRTQLFRAKKLLQEKINQLNDKQHKHIH